MFINDIFNIVKPYIRERRRSSGLLPITKVAATIRFLATGSYQRSIRQDFLIGMSQAAVSDCIGDVLLAMQNNLCASLIKFPTTEAERLKIKIGFFAKFNFPGIIGCIDGTHVDFIAPTEDEELYVDRRGHHSMNVQLVTSICQRFEK